MVSNHLKERKMKTQLGIVALLLACVTGAQAQDSGTGLAGHPDARNDRQMQPEHRSDRHGQTHQGMKPMHHKQHSGTAKHHHSHAAT
jgi:hypothetical protein